MFKSSFHYSFELSWILGSRKETFLARDLISVETFYTGNPFRRNLDSPGFRRAQISVECIPGGILFRRKIYSAENKFRRKAVPIYAKEIVSLGKYISGGKQTSGGKIFRRDFQLGYFNAPRREIFGRIKF